MAKKKAPEEGKWMCLGMYENQLRDEGLWIKTAEELLAAASVLESHIRRCMSTIAEDYRAGRYGPGGDAPRELGPNIYGVHFMLVAYALENLFKAVIVSETKNRPRRVGELPPEAKGHVLKELAQKAGFVPTTVEDEDLLTRLSRNSMWAGRYPFPVKCEDLRNVERYSDGKGYVIAVFYPDDVDRLNGLVGRVKEHVLESMGRH